ncbi:MAG: hypothetical protein WD766_15710 [Gemmatimonadota bacterium]
MSSSPGPTDGASRAPVGQSRLVRLTEELRELEAALRQGGGPERIARQHEQDKLTARERVALLIDPRSRF